MLFGFIFGAILGGIIASVTFRSPIGIIGGAIFGGLMGIGTVAKQKDEDNHKKEVENLLKDIKENKQD